MPNLRCAYLLLFFLSFAMLCETKAEDNLFASDTIEIYAEAEDLYSAKQAALEQGFRKAFLEILYRLYPYYYHERIAHLPEMDIKSLIKRYEITGERLNSDAYRANMVVYFDIDSLRRTLSGFGVVNKFSYSPVLLMLPVLCVSEKCDIWQNADWRQIWDQTPDNYGLLRTVYTIGDLGDIELLGKPSNFVDITFDSISNLLLRYQADEAVILLTYYDKSETRVRIIHISPRMRNNYYMHYKFEIDSEDADNFNFLSQDLLKRLDAKWKGVNMFMDEKPYIYYLKIPSPSPKVWADIRNRLNNTRHILGFSVRSSSAEMMEISIKFDVMPATITQYLAENGLEVYKQGGEAYLRISNAIN
jgi:hypothetical protein